MKDSSMEHDTKLLELTLRGMLLGAVLTVIFTASNVYLGLKVGLTFSSAIPAAVISMAVLRMAKGSNILENNMVQTQASAAGTLSKQRGTLFASGLIVGESIVGVLLAAVIAVSVSGGGSDAPLALAGEDFQDTAEVLGLMAFFVTLAVFGKIVLKK